MRSPLFLRIFAFLLICTGIIAQGQTPRPVAPQVVNRPAQDMSLRPGELLNFDGTVTTEAKAPGNRLLFKTLNNNVQALSAVSDVGQLEPARSTPQAATTADTPTYILPAAGNTPLSQGEITNKLNHLFTWGPARNQYASYFTLLPRQQKLREANASQVLNALDKQALFQPFPITDRTVGVKMVLNTALQTQAMFQGASGSANAIFVRLDAFDNGLVPIQVADQIEANFLNGLVTRLLLGQYERALKLSSNQVSFAQGVPVPSLPKEYNLPASYATGTYDDAVQLLLLNQPVQPMGIYLGWEAGEELDNLSGGDEAFRDDVLQLLKNRFTPAQFGEMTSYTLNFLVGYVKCARIQAIAANPATANAANININDIFKSLSNDEEVISAKALLSGFHRAIMGEFYALSLNPTLSGPQRERMLASEAAFLNGFQAGTVSAADQVFRDVFALGYGYGYKDGFRDGYAQGYAAGWRDGYAAGYAKAWKEAQVVIDRLQRQLDDANSQNSFWNNAGKIAGGIAAVVGLFA